RPAAASSRGDAPVTLRRRIVTAPVPAVIVAATVLALALRGYQLARPGHLLDVGEYDDGADFGSAIWLVHGILPYRDFVLVQPPGITLLMSPVALLSRLTGSTAWALGAGRILTALAGAASVPLGGLLVRHRGLLWGGAAFGFAGAIKVWAIIPVAVICVLCLPQLRLAGRYLAGVAAGFC